MFSFRRHATVCRKVSSSIHSSVYIHYQLRKIIKSTQENRFKQKTRRLLFAMARNARRLETRLSAE